MYSHFDPIYQGCKILYKQGRCTDVYQLSNRHHARSQLAESLILLNTFSRIKDSASSLIMENEELGPIQAKPNN